MKKLFFTLLLLIVFPLMASHIVGGEFELLHISGNSYRLNMILYFDLRNGNKSARDLDVLVSIFRKSDNQHVDSVYLPLVDSVGVGYTQPACSDGLLETAKLVYSKVITLSPDKYNDPAGYYMSWQRCCRNYTIDNIYSGDPAKGQIAAGQTFYLEFPAVVKNGQPFYNSSPHLFPPLNDYACPGRPYYVNFAGVDDDNDSLVYTMVTPLNTTTDDALPPTSPGPYPLVLWKPPFSLNNIMGGHPDLHISLDGFLTCTPSSTKLGLFVFAVKVEQFRDKIKIGESRRDFQMLVVDGCQPDQPPQITGKKLTDPTFTYVNTMTLSFANSVKDGARCIQVRVSDPDSQNPLYHYTQNVTIKAFPLNFKDTTLRDILPAVSTAKLTHGSTADFSICFSKCPLTNGPALIGIVAYDDACSLPLTDTLIISVTIQPPPPNTPPFFTLPAPLPVTQTLLEGNQATWPFQAADNEHDTLFVSVVTDGFVLANAGMTITGLTQQNGLVTGQLHWDAFCDIYDFTRRTSFEVKILVDDKGCGLVPTAATFDLTVKLPPVANPFIVTDLASDPLTLERKVDESLGFNVTGTQADGNFLKLGVTPNGFKLSDHQMVFPPGTGNGLAVSHFQWDIRCNNVDPPKKDTYDFHFTVLDSTNKCRVHKLDTVEVKVKILPPDNTAPSLVIQSLNDVPIVNNEISITLGQPIFVNLLGSDVDILLGKDSLTLKLFDVTGNVPPKGYAFATARGLANVQSPFLWNPDCSIFRNSIYSNSYTFAFSVLDNRCFNNKGDTLLLDVKIKDIVAVQGKFNPPNVITPNGDHCNDYFALDGIDDDADVSSNCKSNDADAEISLPKDDCAGRFQLIQIYNRWGKLVFESTDRKFRWNAQNLDAGEYYYLVTFNNRNMKGWISVRP